MNFNLKTHHIFRIAIAIVYIWFGVLKLLGVSPADTVVLELLHQTFLKFISDSTFILLLGLVEVAIGVVVLIPKVTKYVVVLILLHMFTTFAPLVLLPGLTWQSFGVLTLEGQYIVKNVLIIALVVGLWREK